MEAAKQNLLKPACLLVAILTIIGLFGCASSQGNGSSTSSQTEEAHEVESSESSSSEAKETDDAASSKTAVVYFSATGNTEAVAEKITAATDGTLMRIEPTEPYTEADLDYNSDSRANDEQNDASTRPALAEPIPDVTGYDTIYLGYPIWWGTAPRIILTYLDDADLAAKTVIPFCTSGSSPITGSIAELEEAAPDAHWLDGMRFSASVSQNEVDSWVESLQTNE